jgi:hypothetical protein
MSGPVGKTNPRRLSPAGAVFNYDRLFLAAMAGLAASLAAARGTRLRVDRAEQDKKCGQRKKIFHFHFSG